MPKGKHIYIIDHFRGFLNIDFPWEFTAASFTFFFYKYDVEYLIIVEHIRHFTNSNNLSLRNNLKETMGITVFWYRSLKYCKKVDNHLQYS